MLTRRAPLVRGSWTRKRKVPHQDSQKRALYEARIKAAQASKARDKALTWGCEYRSVFLAGVYKMAGCAACSRHDPRPFHPHHVAHRSRKGRAESLTPLCPSCHTEDGQGGVEGRAAKLYGVDLLEVARALARRGTELGFLPVEECAGCGAWHSKRYMLDDLDQGTGIVRRLCVDCVPPGPI